MDAESQKMGSEKIDLEDKVNGGDNEKMDYSGGFSNEAHRNIVDSFRKPRTNNYQADGDWLRLDKELSDLAGMKIDGLKEKVYDFLHNTKIANLYEKDMKRHINKFRKKHDEISRLISQYENKLNGRAEYIPPKSLNIESLEKAIRVRESDKGLFFKLEELKDSARILGHNYRAGEIALEEYNSKIADISQDIEKISQDKSDPGAAYKISKLSNLKNELVQDKSKLMDTQRAYMNEIKLYGRKIERMRGKVDKYDLLVSKGKNRLHSIEVVIDELDDFSTEKKDAKSINKVLADMRYLMDEEAKFGAVNEKQREVYLKGIEDITDSLNDNGGSRTYDNSDIGKKIGHLKTEDYVRSQKEVSKILVDLGV